MDTGAITSSVLVQTLSHRLGVPGCVLRHGLMDPNVAKSIPKEEAERLRVLPIFKVRDVLTVAMVEPQSLPAQDRLEHLTGCTIRPILVLDENLEEFQHKYLADDVNVDSFLAAMDDGEI